jgi:prefoldin subunit 5
MTNQTGQQAQDLDALDAEMQATEDELAALEQEAGAVRYRIRELQTREGYEPQKVAAEGGHEAPVPALGRHRQGEGRQRDDAA